MFIGVDSGARGQIVSLASEAFMYIHTLSMQAMMALVSQAIEH